MIELTDLQEDILTLAVVHDDITNREIADTLECSEEYVGEVRRDYEGKVDESKVDGNLNTTYKNASDITPGTSESTMGFIEFLIVGPIKLVVWTLTTTMKVTFVLLAVTMKVFLWAVALPFRILDTLLGSN